MKRAGHAHRTSAASIVAALATLALPLVALMLLAPVVLADTASNPQASETSNNLLLGIVALGVLSAVLILTRPRRGPR